jgi:hypothetical protein
MTVKAKAVLTFDQIANLLEGIPITIRLPKQKDSPAIEVEVIRAPIPQEVFYKYTVTATERPIEEFDMSFTDKLFSDVGEMFDTLGKNFRSIFKLPSSK